MSESDDMREFLRQQRLIDDRRHERSMKQLELQRREMERHFDKQDRKLDDVLEENRAQRAALFRILDRLDNGGAATA